MALTDPLPTGVEDAARQHGFSLLFNAGVLGSRSVGGPKRIQLDTLEVDCTLSEAYAYEADVTDFEVEKGANVSDHRRTKPVEFSISGLISDTPLDVDAPQQAVSTAASRLGLPNPIAQTALSGVQTAQGLLGASVLTSDAIFTKDA